MYIVILRNQLPFLYITVFFFLFSSFSLFYGLSYFCTGQITIEQDAFCEFSPKMPFLIKGFLIPAVASLKGYTNTWKLPITFWRADTFIKVTMLTRL